MAWLPCIVVRSKNLSEQGREPERCYMAAWGVGLANLFLYSHVRRVFLLVSSLAANSNDPACSYRGFQSNCQGTEKPSGIRMSSKVTGYIWLQRSCN